MSGEEAGGQPSGVAGLSRVSPVSLYSYLVTRPTGRAVRLGIQKRLAECNRQVLAVLDFREVQLIDFSCADEIVAKLVRESQLGAAARFEAYFLFSGLLPHHLEPVESALRRQGLAVAAERVDGEPVLLGAVSRFPERAWYALCRLGRAAPAAVAGALKTAEEEALELLEVLLARRLLLRDGTDYLSFRQALEEGGRAGEG